MTDQMRCTPGGEAYKKETRRTLPLNREPKCKTPEKPNATSNATLPVRPNNSPKNL